MVKVLSPLVFLNLFEPQHIFYILTKIKGTPLFINNTNQVDMDFSRAYLMIFHGPLCAAQWMGNTGLGQKQVKNTALVFVLRGF